MTITELVEDTLNEIHGMLINYEGALDIFSEVVRSSSKEEAAPRDPGVLVVKELTRFTIGKLKDAALEVVPGGDVAKDLLGLLTSIDDAATAEIERAQTASEENALKDFITDQIRRLTEAQSDLVANKKNDAAAIRARYEALGSERLRESLRFHHEYLNHRMSQARKTSFTVDALFRRLSAKWITETKIPGTNYDSSIIVNIDRNWRTMSAYVNAPRGSRLAEQLVDNPAGAVDVRGMDVPLRIRWYPRSGEKWGSLARCDASMNASGELTRVGATMFGAKYTALFLLNLASKPIEPAETVTGAKS